MAKHNPSTRRKFMFTSISGILGATIKTGILLLDLTPQNNHCTI